METIINIALYVIGLHVLGGCAAILLVRVWFSPLFYPRRDFTDSVSRDLAKITVLCLLLGWIAFLAIAAAALFGGEQVLEFVRRLRK